MKLRERERWSEWKSEFPIEFNIKLVHKESGAYHFQSLLRSCIKRFTTKGKQTLSHFLEKHLASKAIYQLKKYNKAWPNTNLAKTPILFTVEFQELLEIFWETYRFNARECFFSILFDCINVAEFLPGFKFSTSHFICVLNVFFVFLMNRLTVNERDTYISQMKLASGTGNPGWPRTRLRSRFAAIKSVSFLL